jgi:cobalt-zinc-cadmium efflux system protein
MGEDGHDHADHKHAIASLLVAVLMLRSGFDLRRKAIRVLLEGAPEGMPPAEVGVAMAHGEHVKEVHDLHLWELAPGHPILTAHVLVAPGEDCHAVGLRARADAERALQDRAHDTAGRSRAPASAVDSAAGSLAFDYFVTRRIRGSTDDSKCS